VNVHSLPPAMRNPSSTRDRIEHAALRLFVEKGIAETSIRDIAQRAGIADGALYRHYKSKDELVWQLFSSRYLAFAETLDGLQLGHPTAKRKLDAMVRGFCAFFDRDWELFAFLLMRRRRFLPLFGTQFLGAFNDNLFKSALVMLATYRLDEGNAPLLVTLA